MWDFTKLPKGSKETIVKLVEDNEAVKLMLLHNKHKLSKYYYCCGKDEESIIKWFTYGIENKLIK